MKRNQLNRHVFAIIGQLSILCMFISGTGRSATLNWTNTAGGSWSVPENWEPNQVPGAGDTATITNVGSYTVTLDANYYPVDNITLGGGTGGQTLVLLGSQLACSGMLIVNWCFAKYVAGVLAGHRG